jgi:hypothetical protein
MFVHAFCADSPCFRMKSPHRSHIVGNAWPEGEYRVFMERSDVRSCFRLPAVVDRG